MRTRLLASIANRRLVIVCGAGLSMDEPSCLPSARRVAQLCFDRYRALINPDAPVAIRDNLEQVADLLIAESQFVDIFINQIVPWATLVRLPNAGHRAIADLIATGAALVCLSANYDVLIERAAWNEGNDIQVAVDGNGALAMPPAVTRLIKFHGSAAERRDLTVWSPQQFDACPELMARRQSVENWIQARLPDTDLLFVGFWSDWDYLNATLAQVFDQAAPRSITLIDPENVANLESKAQGLWELAHRPNVQFEHVAEGAVAFLSELQAAFSWSIIASVILTGVVHFNQIRPDVEFDPAWVEPPPLAASELVAWRRDIEGKTAVEPPLLTPPIPGHEMVGCLHILLRSLGGEPEGRGYRLGERKIRVVNGSDRFLSDVPELFAEAPAVDIEELVIVVGATDLGNVPNHQVRSADLPSVVRHTSTARWLDAGMAIAELVG